jgi:hypothetical protein
MLNIKLCKLNKMECIWDDLDVPVVIHYTVVSSVLGALCSGAVRCLIISN